MPMKILLTSFLALLVAASLPAAASDTVYKWKDESGRVHFSDRPLRDADAEEIKVTPPRAATEEDDSGDADETEDEEGGEDAPPADNTAKQAGMERQQKQIREQNCKIARQTLEHNESIQRMYRVDANGERVFLSDEEREMVLDKSRQDAEKWCD